MKKLYKSNDDKVISGVLAGISEYMEIDPLILRVLTVVLAFISQGVPIVLLYIILAVSMKEEPLDSDYSDYESSHWGHPGGSDNYSANRKQAEDVEVEDEDDDEWSDF